MQSPFSAAIADKPLRPFQWLVIVAALIVLVIEGVDLQSLPILAPEVLKEWGIDREDFGLALTAALAGMAVGSFCGGWLGDRWGRLKALFLAALIFGASTVAAAYTHDVPTMAAIRMLGGIGFGAGYPNALALVNDWVPARIRTYVIATLSIGIPLGTTIAAYAVPPLLPDYGWRGILQIFGVGSLILGLYDGDALRPVGHISGFSAEAKRSMRAMLAPLETGESGTAEPSRWTGGRDLEWVALRPELVIEVAYDYMEGDRFRHTTQFRRWRPDRTPESCTYSQLEEPADYNLGEILKLQ